MASSDDEGEFLPECVINYQILNDENQPISFSCLPLQLSMDETADGLKMRVFLHGASDSGIEKIYKQVVAWRYDLNHFQPDIFVLCKTKQWIKLLKPNKRFENTIRTTLITLHFLHFVKRSPEVLEESIWRHLSKVFSSYDAEPSEDDILHHIALIRAAAKKDEVLLKSEYVLDILSGKPRKGRQPHEGRTLKKSDFIVYEDADDLDGLDEEEEELFDTCCALCDNGGDILCCEGRCMRSFHPTIASGEGYCRSLGLTEAQVEDLPNFLCKNCKYKQHQCFVCGKLGCSESSDESGAEVFRCEAATCGRFYHPRCAAKALQKAQGSQVEEFGKKIAAGKSFTCPAHKCFVCKQVEERKIFDLQFAVCRRCPKAYHRKCLPRSIYFQSDVERNILQRAWDGLLPKRILIYCLDHEIIPELGTPPRDHILFPGIGEIKRRIASVGRAMEKKGIMVSQYPLMERSAAQLRKKSENNILKPREFVVKVGKYMGVDDFHPPKKVKFVTNAVTSQSSKISVKSVATKAHCSSTASQSKVVPEKKRLISEKITSSAYMFEWKPGSSQAIAASETEANIRAIVQEVNSSFNKDEFIKKQKNPSTCAYSRNTVDKKLTKGKVEGAVEAVRTALKKLDEGCSIEDAMAICAPEMLYQIHRWKKKLDIYLAPFLHGMRYSSYGRHFTKLEKLQQIVDKLHWYVQDGDMMVDFCCGANDFSCLMKEKLESTGKQCLFKNYDLFRPKNDFMFEQRNWFSVGLEELPVGSSLIMGLNPPFGVKAALANQFIDKALTFKPKLLILIVPRETQRLDAKKIPYDLVWEDEYLLSGKSFYLPGSVDVHDKQLEQWNLKAPPLYLWSHADWTEKHTGIARKCGHLPQAAEQIRPVAWNYLEDSHCYHDFSTLMHGYGGGLPCMWDNVPGDN